jgi:hypothetical protein
MSNPPAGWYPDPTGQPHTIRFWNGEKWTNKTAHEDEAAALAAEESTAKDDPTPTPHPAEPASSEPTEPAQQQPGPTQPAPEPAQQQFWPAEQNAQPESAQQPWSADQFTSYDQPNPDTEQTQQQPWSGNQQPWTADQQPWSADQFSSYEQADPNTEQTQQQPWSAQQPWPEQQSTPADQPQQPWTATQQPWSADQFSSYDQPNPDTEQTQQQSWATQPEPTPQHSPQQGNPSAPTHEQSHQQPWSAQQPWPEQQSTPADQPQQPWTATQQPWSADQFTSYDQPTPDQTPQQATPQNWGAEQQPVQPVQSESQAPGLRAVQETGAGDAAQADQASGGGWWQPAPTPQLWSSPSTGNDAPASGGARLRAVSPAQPDPSAQTDAAPTASAGEPAPSAAPAAAASSAAAGEAASSASGEEELSAADRARATWGAPELAPAPPDHWTQREISEFEAAQAAADVDVQPEEQSSGWTLKLAPEPAAGQQAADGQAAQTADDRAAETADEQAAQVADEQVARVADERAADELAAEQAADEAEAAGLQPNWGSQSGDEQDQEATDIPAWGVETADDADPKTSKQAAPLWTVPGAPDTAPDQPVQLWGDQPQQPTPAQDQTWNGQQVGSQGTGAAAAAQPGQVWGSQQATAGAQTGQQGGDQSWGGQSWPVEQPSNQQNVQQTGQPQWGAQQGAGVQQGGQQPWGDQPTQRAWGDDGNEAWGGQTDLSTGVGKRDSKSKKSKSSGGGGPFGGKMPLIIAGGVAVVLLIVAAVVLLTKGDDTTANPDPTGTPTQSGSPSPTNQSSTKPGQSKDPKLHEGAGRIASDAISFPRRNPPWSDRKRLVQQLINSNGQRIVLKEDVVEGDDWSADIFVGALGTGSGFNGDPKATAASLSIKLRENMYGNIPVTFKTVANGPVKRTEKAGWVFQQTVTATTTAVTDRVLTLTVAVFDLGDGTAVAYISGIPNNRPDLKKAADQAYLGINVG